MQIQERKIQYFDDEKIFSFQDTLAEDMSFKVFVACETDKFTQFQKDILEDFVADFTSIIKTSKDLEINDIKALFEESLQILNTKFKQFADKVRDIERFQLKGVIQLVIDKALMASMIGNSTLIILRDQKILYTLSNTIDIRAKIDLFSDFIEGALEAGDQVIYVGTKLTDVIDQHDRKQMETILAGEDSSEGVITFLEELLTTRLEKSDLGFIISYHLTSQLLRKITSGAKKGKKSLKNIKSLGYKETASRIVSNTGAYIDALGDKIHSSPTVQNIKSSFSRNRYYVVALGLGLLIIFMIYAVASQRTSKQDPANMFQTSDGVYVNITLEGIQQAMAEFQQLDVTDKLKSDKYSEIKRQLEYLESKGKRVEEVATLKKYLETEYYKGFNIILVNDLAGFDDNANGRKTTVMTINNAELSRLGNLHTIQVPNNMMIAGDKGAIVNASSESNKGVIIEYNLSQPLTNCSISLLKDGLYCYNTAGEIYLVQKSGLSPVTTSDGDFKPNIGGVGTFNRNNLYVFQKSIDNLGTSLVTRYRNTAGSESTFQGGTSYSVDLASGATIAEFSSFAIDGSFLAWSDGKPYLFRRSDPAGSKLSYRVIELMGGDTSTQSFSKNVKIITSAETRYIYLFDKDNQTFTVYDTASIKTNDANKSTYKMRYLFSFKFNLANSKVLDVAIPDTTANKPELYILSSTQINKINLTDFIDSVVNVGQLKTLNM